MRRTTPARYQSPHAPDLPRRDSEDGRIETTVPVPVPPTGPQVRAWTDWILGSLLAHEPFSYCAVLVLDASGDALLVVGERRLSDVDDLVAPVAGPVPLDGSVCGTVFRSGTPVLVSDVREHPGCEVLPGGTTRSKLAVPVLRGGRAIAVIDIESPRVGGVDIADLHRLTAFAARAAETAPSALGPASDVA